MMRLNRKNIIQILVQIPCMGCWCVAIATTSNDRTRHLSSKTGFITINRTLQFDNDTNTVKVATVKKDSAIEKGVVLSELVCTGTLGLRSASIAKSIFPVKTILYVSLKD